MRLKEVDTYVSNERHIVTFEFDSRSYSFAVGTGATQHELISALTSLASLMKKEYREGVE